MNPDGTGQLALYGSNSWFPTAFRFAKPVPDHPTRLVGIISGHHDFGDCGRLAMLDPGLAGGYPFRYPPEVEGVGRRRRADRGDAGHPAGRADRLSATDSRPRQDGGRHGVRRHHRARVPQRAAGADHASLSAQQQVLPRVDETHAAEPVGHLPGGRVRQRDADRGDRRRGVVRAAAAGGPAPAAGHPRSGQARIAGRPRSTSRTSTAGPACRACRAARSRACGSSRTTSATTPRPGFRSSARRPAGT